MDIIQIVLIGIIGMILSIILKKECPTISIFISIVIGIIIFMGILPKIESVIQMLYKIIAKGDIDVKYIDIILKVIGISYISQFASQICSDAGEGAIATKIEFAGKIVIMLMSVPIITSLIEMIFEMMP